MKNRAVIESFLVILLVAFVLVIPVLAVSYNPGVSAGKYVKWSWYAVNVTNKNYIMSWEKIEVVRVVGEEVDWQMTGEMTNGSAAPDNGETYFTNVQTGTTNYTHANVGPIIAGDLNAGDKVSMASSIVVNTTETMTYLGVSRSVNVLTVNALGVGVNGASNTSTTYVYDKASGMLLETESRQTWLNETNPEIYLDMPVSDTNLFSSQKGQAGLFGILIPVVAVVVLVPVSIVLVVVRRQKQLGAKTATKEHEAGDLTINLGAVNSGECYLADSLERCMKVISDLKSRGIDAMAIVRENPLFVAKSCNLSPDRVILLSGKPVEPFKAINSLQDVSIAITKFVKAGGGAVLLDGLEYLISRFGFNAVYMMLQEKKIEFLEAGAVLLVPVT
ncbi:MAG TPA: DUF835 domain-containing protein, partial [Candidatus Acidoferrales bacterium]|nr:DUF835 domain-containing protein [Candidatus Acidoferrales bacterium]